MHNDYPHKPNGLPIMRMADINDFALRVVLEFAPECLRKPMALDIKTLAEEQLLLDIVETPMFIETMLGLTAFGIVTIPIDSHNHYIAVEDLSQSG